MKKSRLKSQKFTGVLFWFSLLMLLYSSCSRMDDDSPANLNETGHLKLFITDDPVQWQDISGVNVTIEKVVLKKAEPCESDDDDEGEDSLENDDNRYGHIDGYGMNSMRGDSMRGDHGWENGEDSAFYVVLFDTPMVINLLELRNGVTMLLSEMDIPAGTYSQVRLFISKAVLKMVNGDEFELEIPSALTSGLKIMITPALVIEEGMSEELLLDIDLSRSLVVIGPIDDPLGFKFNPVIRSATNSSSGRIEGLVSDISEDAVNGASVWLEGDSVISSAISNEAGFYKMIGIPEGSYSLYAVMEDYDTARYENIQITSTGITQVDIQLTPVNLNGIFIDQGPEKLFKIISRQMIAGNFLRVITKNRGNLASR